jgi:hypothetical protein
MTSPKPSNSPIFDPSQTKLSPTDLGRHVSLRARIFLFVTAWASVLWFLGAPFVPSLHYYFGVSAIIFQIWWLSLMLWVCYWANSAIGVCRAKFNVALDVLVNTKYRHASSPPGYLLPPIVHWVIIPNYREDVNVLRATLTSLAVQSIGAKRIGVVLACEAAESNFMEKVSPLAAEFGEFGKFVIAVHRLRQEEVAGKSANTSNAFKLLCASIYRNVDELRLRSVVNTHKENDAAYWCESEDQRAVENDLYRASYDNGIVTVMDADSVLHPFHLWEIEQSYYHGHFEHRRQTIWQAPIANTLNLYSVPACTRLMSIAVSLHELASQVHPTCQKVPFSTYSLSFQLALKMGGWAVDVLAEDWHAYERAFFAEHGNCRIVPLHFPVLCYSVEATDGGWWASMHARFVQAKRHSWGVIEFACMVAFWRDTPWYHRPPTWAFLDAIWKMFKLHYTAIYQTPMVVGSTIFHFILSARGYVYWHPPAHASDAEENMWVIYYVLSALMAVLPVVTLLSFSATLRYLELLREQHVTLWCTDCAWRAASLVAVKRHLGWDPMRAAELPEERIWHYLEGSLWQPASVRWQRVRLFFEFLLVMPVASLVFGFVPALISQTFLPFQKYYTYIVAAKPHKENV